MKVISGIRPAPLQAMGLIESESCLPCNVEGSRVVPRNIVFRPWSCISRLQGFLFKKGEKNEEYLP